MLQSPLWCPAQPQDFLCFWTPTAVTDGTYRFGEAIKGWRMFPSLIDRYFKCGKIDTSVELDQHCHMKCEFTKIKLLYPEYETMILSMYDIFSKCFQISKKARRAPVQRLWCISRELFPPLQESDQMNMVCKVIDWRLSVLNTYT